MLEQLAILKIELSKRYLSKEPSWCFVRKNKKLSLESFQQFISLPVRNNRRVLFSGIDLDMIEDRSISTGCSCELEYHHGPPGVDQHHKSKHPKGQSFLLACLLVTDTPVLHKSLEFIFGSFHISKVIHVLISFDSYDEDPGRMSLLARIFIGER
jgi:hypothetical protein